ncbi:helicase-exonuclease AddAB subunit AddA [Oscillospiraceae bacterium MB08-C2-2]|nr:helicase-exonuclease AddAB subunit AddA [Oscillospiraceae bacterium MB08-C2-2]
MADTRWTKPQQDAIFALGGPLLVSAAAGSGKTAVLAERAVTLMTREQEPISAERLLVVTFSRAAAGEMKQRIAARLGELCRRQPENLFLQRQRVLLDMAKISTVHSFCLDLIRQNFHRLELSPDLVLLDESQLMLMKNDCAREVVEDFYREDTTGEFAGLVELLAGGRDDRRLLETVFKIYDFSRSHPFFEDWLAGKLALYDSSIPPGETPWGQVLLAYGAEQLEYLARSIEDFLPVMEGDEKLWPAYGPAFMEDLQRIREALASALKNRWDELVERLGGITFSRLSPVRGAGPDKDRAQALRQRVKKAIGELSGKAFSASAADFAADIADLQPRIRLLFDLVLRFASRLDALKQERRALDFTDLEHYALQLLVEKDVGGQYIPTEYAKDIASQFDCVMVDEFQDTNEVQDQILSGVSAGGSNLFMVGDVKQSIYRFRLAMPEIFMAKKEQFAPYEEGAYPAKINLDTNFRSRDTVIGWVNYIFASLMSRSLGEIEYTHEETLKPGASYPEYPACFSELHLLDISESETEEDSALLEARLVARRITRLFEEGYQVTELGALRPLRLGDICILMRSPRGRAELYVRELAAWGIAAWSETAGGFLRTREVAAVVCLLKAIDNPLLDIELTAALLSPTFGFTEDDLAAIRLCRKGPFYLALRASAEEGNMKAQGFLQAFARLTIEAGLRPADEVIRLILEETGFLAAVQVWPMGQSRKANLLLLMEYAAQYHKLGYKQVSGFVGFLSRLEEREGDLTPASRMGEGADAVQILSIHRSKGLEFPVVFLADTARQFNRQDLMQPTLLHSSLGFACVRRDPVLLKQYPTVPMEAVRLETQRSMLSEELRVLYVALTRAREKLIVTGTLRRGLSKRLEGFGALGSQKQLPPALVRGGNCYLDWLLMALLRHPGGEILREQLSETEVFVMEDATPWQVVLSVPEEQKDTVSNQPIIRTAQADETLKALVEQRLDWRYSFEEATRIPAKLAVSAVAKAESGAGYRFNSRPKFLTRQTLTGAEKGNALHQFMQFSNYENARDHLKQEIQRLREKRFLSPIQAESLDEKKLSEFFHSQLAQRIFAADALYRELRFMGGCTREQLGEYLPYLTAGHTISLQGVADCVFVEKGQAVIVDYKTDRVKTPQELRERYTPQLKLYRHILKKTLEMPVKQCLLYSFSLGCQVEIEP